MKEKIMDYITQENHPVSILEICNVMNINVNTARKYLMELFEENRLIRSEMKNMYIVKKESEDANEVSQLYVDAIDEIAVKVDCLENQYGKIQKYVENSYTKIIEIMGVFAAILSLLFTNISILSQSNFNGISNCDLFKRVLVINGAQVIPLSILLGLIKLIILRTKFGKKK